MLQNAPLVGFVPSRDLAAARDFYEGTLGLRLLHEDEYALVFDSGGRMLRVAQVPPFTPHPFTILGWEAADLTAAVRHLAARGVTFVRFDGIEQDADGVWTTPNGYRVAWFRDPEGNTLSLSSSG